MQGCGGANKCDCKDVFRKGKSELFSLTETKTKETRKVSRYGVNGICVGVHENERAMEGVTILLNNVW